MVLEEVLKDGWTVEIPLESVYVDEAGYYSGMDDQLNIFMTGWSSHAYDYTLKVCDPEWKEAHEDPQAALKELTRNATMLEKRVERVDGAKDDPVRTVVCTVSVRLPGEKAYTSFRLDIEMRKAEDGLWYINPDSLETWTAVNENADEPAEAAEAETK